MALNFSGLVGGLNSLSALPGVSALPGSGVINTATSLLARFLGGGVKDHERPDLQRIAAATGLTEQQASDLCGMEEKRSPDNYDAIVKKYADNPSGLLSLVAEWNGKNPSNQIVASAPEPMGIPASVQQSLTLPLVVPATVQQSLTGNSLVAAPAEAAATNSQVGDAAKAVIKGAQGGLSDWFMGTDAGKQAKSDGAMSWAKDNFLILTGAGVALGLLIYKAFFSKK